MLLTTRGAALKDLARLAEAEQSAISAITLTPNGFYPYNLLGAIRYQSGQPEEAITYFQKAKELGAPEREQDKFIISALRRAGDGERRRVGEYLAVRDSETFRKFSQFFE